MTGFEPRNSGIGSDCSTNWATTTALVTKRFLLIIFRRKRQNEVRVSWRLSDEKKQSWPENFKPKFPNLRAIQLTFLSLSPSPTRISFLFLSAFYFARYEYFFNESVSVGFSFFVKLCHFQPLFSLYSSFQYK